MLFKNILLGIGGSAVIGGIGYGIYSSSQVSKKEEQKTTDIEKTLDSGSSPEGQGRDSEQQREGDDSGKTDNNPTITSKNTDTQYTDSSERNGAVTQ